MSDPLRSPADPADAWLDETAEPPFTPPRTSGRLPWLAFLLALGGAGLIGVSVWGQGGSVEVLRSAGPSLLELVRETVMPEAPGGAPTPAEPAAQTHALAPGAPAAPMTPQSTPSATGHPGPQQVDSLPAARATVRKCVRNGQVTFTDAPCPPGAQVEDLVLPGVAVSGAAAAAGVTLYRCRNHDGAHFWTRTHCHRQGARVDRITEVPAELSLAQQTRLAEQRRLELGAAAVPAPAPRQRLAQGPAGTAGSRDRCARIALRIDNIDSEARRPLTGPRQDQLRSERQGLRDEQFSLRCP